MRCWRRSAGAQFVAEQVTVGNAPTRLFQGTDADGGIGDWYLSNGVVEAIIDDVGPQADLVGAARSQRAAEGQRGRLHRRLADRPRPRRHEQRPARADVHRRRPQHQQLHPLRQHRRLDRHALRPPSPCTGGLLGFDPNPAQPACRWSPQYTASGSDPFLTITTTVTNTSSITASGAGRLPRRLHLGDARRHSLLAARRTAASRHAALDSRQPGCVARAARLLRRPGQRVAGRRRHRSAQRPHAPARCRTACSASSRIDRPRRSGRHPAGRQLASNSLFGISSNLITAFGNLPLGSLSPGGVLQLHAAHLRRRPQRRRQRRQRHDHRARVAPGVRDRHDLRRRRTPTTPPTSPPASSPPAPAARPSRSFPDGTPVTQFRTDATGAFSGIVLPVGTYDLDGARARARPGHGQRRHRQRRDQHGGHHPAADRPRHAGAHRPRARHAAPIRWCPPRSRSRASAARRTRTCATTSTRCRCSPPGRPQDILPETFAGGPGQRNWVFLADGTETSPAAARPLRALRLARPRVRRLQAARARPRGQDAQAQVHPAPHRRHHRLHVGRLPHPLGAQPRHLAAAARPRRLVRRRGPRGDGQQRPRLPPRLRADHRRPRHRQPHHLDRRQRGHHLGAQPARPSRTRIGHINAWPLPVDRRRAARRLHPGRVRRSELHLFAPARPGRRRSIQYNHVRAGLSGLTSIGFFNNFGYDPDLPLTSPPNNLLLDTDVLGPGVSGVSNPGRLPQHRLRRAGDRQRHRRCPATWRCGATGSRCSTRPTSSPCPSCPAPACPTRTD